MNRRRWSSLAVVAILAAGLLLYGRTLPFPFVFDDHIYLVGNPLMKELRNFALPDGFTALATLAGRMGLDPDLSTNFILRPLGYLTFHLNFALGGLNPAGYRAVNIAVHILNALLIFVLLRRLLAPRPGREPLPPFSAGFVPFLAAMLFLAHPMQIESVTYIVQRFTSLGTMFYLLTVIAHLRSIDAERRGAALAFRAASVVALLAGMLTKEFLVTAPLMLVLIDRALLGTPWRRAAFRALPQLLCLPLIPALVLLTSAAQHGGAGGMAAALNIANPRGPDYARQYVLTQPGVVGTYLRMLVAPGGFNLDPERPLCLAWHEARVLVPAALLALLGVAALAWPRRRGGGLRSALLRGGVLWFFVTIAVDSSIVPLPDVMAEHRAYLPSVGLLAALACAVDLLRTAWPARRPATVAVLAACGAWVVLLGASTWARHDVWSSELAMWSDVVAKSPGKARAWLNLGVVHYERREMGEAAACFGRVMELVPGCPIPYVNLGTMRNIEGRYREGLEASAAGLRFAPADVDLHYNLGVALCGLGRAPDGVQVFEAALRLRATHRPTHLALGQVYAGLGRYAEALGHFKTAGALQPLDPDARAIVQAIENLIQPPPANAIAGIPAAGSARVE